MPVQNNPYLYGITAENSARSGSNLWGKNQFNTTFPLSLCLYMRDNDIRPVSIRLLNGLPKTDDTVWRMSDVVGDIADDPYYSFEMPFEPYRMYSRNELDNIDLVVSYGNVPIRPLEIKLTVVPDIGTATMSEESWAPELVIRPVSSAHAMTGIAHSLLNSADPHLKDEVIDAIRPTYNSISDWNNQSELLAHASQIHKALKSALRISENIQEPFLLQPLWRTKGQSLILANSCFDVFVWSDVAVVALPMLEYNPDTKTRVSRMFREMARHTRGLYDVLTTGDHNYREIYKGMAHGNQTDKSFAMSGKKTINYLKHDRLLSPTMPSRILYDLVLDGGESNLRPERRFDAAVQVHLNNNPPSN